MADTVEKNIKINLDANIEPTLKNLRELKLALKSAAAGSDDFRKIQAKIDDVQDSLKGAKTSAGNFVDILGTVPGPIGDIGAKASGTIDILKSFGRLKLTDIKKSFMDLGGDLKEAGKGIANLTGLTKVYTKVNDFLSGSFIKLGAAEGTAAIGAKAFSVALISTGIGAIVVGLGLLIGALIEFVSGEKEATAEIDKFNAAIEASNNAIEDQTATLVREHQKQLADLKATGASEKAIRDKELQQRKEDLVNAQNIEAKKLKDLRAAYLIEDEDNRKAAIKKANDDYRGATKTRKDLDANYYVKAQENRGADLKDSDKAAADAAKIQAESNKTALANQKKYKEQRAAIASEIARTQLELDYAGYQEIYGMEMDFLEKSAELDVKALDAKLANRDIVQKEYDKLKFQREEKLNIDIENLQTEYLKKAAEANKELVEMQAHTLEEKKHLESIASYDKFSNLEESLANETQIYYDQKVKELELSSEGLLDEEQLIIRRGEIETEASELTLKKLAALKEESLLAQAAINEKYAKQAADKSLSDLKKQQEAEFLQQKAAAEEVRDLVVNNKKSTDYEKEQAEKVYAERIRALQQKQLEDQIALLNQAAGLSEEAKEANNLEILKLQDKLNENLDSKYKEDTKNYGEAWLEKNKVALEVIAGTLQAATASINALAEFQKMKNQEELEATKAKYDLQANELRYNYDLAITQAGLTAKQKEDIETDYANASNTIEFERAKENYKREKDGFDNGKKLQYAQAVIAGIQSAMGAFSSLAPIPYVGPILGAIAAAAVGVTTAFQLATISKTTYSGVAPVKPKKVEAGGGGAAGGSSGSKFAEGGLLTGRKHSEGGIPTSLGQLEGGEYVVNRSATEAFMPLLDKINGMGKGSGAPNNLSVIGEQTIPAPAPIIKTYVVASDMSSQQEANKRLEQIARL